MKKILTCLMAAVVLIMSLPITALADSTPFTTQEADGYFPAQAHTMEKYYYGVARLVTKRT